MKKFSFVLIALFLLSGMHAQTITVAQALEIGNALDNKSETTESYTIEGYVNVITENSFNTTYNNMTFWIADTRGIASSSANGALQVFRGRPDKELQEGDKIRVVAKLKKWYETIETVPANAPVTWLESKPEEVDDTIKGSLRVCAQNLENYYFNLNTGRGDYTPEEFIAKTRKIVNNMVTIDADIFAFCEVEAQEIVLKQLADSMNKRVEGEPYVPVMDGINEDWSESYDNNIKSGFIYRKDKVKTVGQSYPGTPGSGYYSHTMRIQTFEELASKERFTLSMNHFKAKDNTDDKGNSKRVTNANNLISSLNTYASDPDILILGDLNCEVGEEPITIIQNAGFDELLLKYYADSYSHCYNGGELIDHAMANASMAEQVVNAYVKHVSAYKCNPKVSQAQSYSDHDPYVVEITLKGKPKGECEDIDASFLATGGTGLGDMTAESISGQYFWRYQSQYGATCQDKGGEDWLITPTYDMSEMKSISIEFEHALNYANVDNISNEQTLWVTADYSSVAGSEWHQLTIPNYPAGTNWTFVKTNVSVPIELVGENTAFAFKYKVANDATNKPTWEIKNLNIKATCNGGTTETINSTSDIQPKAVKLIQNGHIYIILPDGTVYNALGQKIK